MNEQEILEAIAQAEADRVRSKAKIARLQREIDDRESDLIEATVRKDRLLEQLRVHKQTTITYDLDYRDREILAFKAVFPQLSKKIDEEEGAKLKK